MRKEMEPKKRKKKIDEIDIDQYTLLRALNKDMIDFLNEEQLRLAQQSLAVIPCEFLPYCMCWVLGVRGVQMAFLAMAQDHN